MSQKPQKRKEPEKVERTRTSIEITLCRPLLYKDQKTQGFWLDPN